MKDNGKGDHRGTQGFGRGGEVKAPCLFSLWELKDSIRDQEAVDKARDEDHKKTLADAEAAIADSKAARAGGDAEKGKAEGGDAELDKYLDPKKNPFIKLD